LERSQSAIKRSVGAEAVVIMLTNIFILFV